MPTLACRTCGRVLDIAVALETLPAEDRRCPRCGAILASERRGENRRKVERRQNAPDDPGPPGGIERRVADRRQDPRRRGDGSSRDGA